MLKRKMTGKLAQWLARPKRKALLLTGARQTGKTFTVRAFAHEHFDNFVEVNFIESKRAASLLASAIDTQDFIARLSLLAEKPLNQGKTIVFLDEIQASKDILTMAKFLVEDDRFDLILSGSMLGVELRSIRSFPVGYIHEEHMRPLDFEEFCWSQGVPQEILDAVHTCYREKAPLEQSLHERLVRLFRLYIAVGGMPEAVQAFITGRHDLAIVRDAQQDIVKQYKADISQYAPERSIFIQAIFDAIPSELSKANKRFVLQSLKKGATYERFQDDFEWICAAGAALPACLVAEPKFPLRRTRERRKFKLYQSDTGLLMAQYPRQIAMDVLSGSKKVNFGSVYENIVAQEIAAAGISLSYFNSNRKGEIDFLLETSDGRIVPVEVKSGKDYKIHTALNNLLETKDYGIDCAVVLSEANLSEGMRKGKPVFYLPLYMTSCIASDCSEGETPFVVDIPSF